MTAVNWNEECFFLLVAVVTDGDDDGGGGECSSCGNVHVICGDEEIGGETTTGSCRRGAFVVYNLEERSVHIY